MVASIEKSSTLNFRKQKNKIVIRHSDIEDMNPSIPDEGEVVYATDTNELYIGDGLTKVEELSPISGGGSGSTNYNELTNKPWPQLWSPAWLHEGRGSGSASAGSRPG